MHIRSTPLRVLALACGLLGGAPAAMAQKLTPMVGAPISYRVSLPSGAEIKDDGETLTAQTEDVIVFIAAVDLVAAQDEPLPVSDAESRRIMTSMFMGSDSLLFGLMDHALEEHDVGLTGAVREIRTLGGERAAYVRGEFEEAGEAAWMEMHLTVKDGIMYLLIVGGCRDNASIALASRIRESFVLADAPPPAESRPQDSSTIRPIRRSR